MSTGDQVEQQVNVPMNLIIDQLHAKYGRMLGQLMQENAELQAGVEVLGNECSELRSKAVMLGEQLAMQRTSSRAPEGPQGPGGSGLLSASGQALTGADPRERNPGY